MLTQTTVIENTLEQLEPILIRGPRELKWNQIILSSDLVEVTPEQVEQSLRRAAYVQEFNPCGIEGW